MQIHVSVFRIPPAPDRETMHNRETMHTLGLRQVPDHHYRLLKAVAAAHHRSMNQAAILALEAGLPGEPPPHPSDVEASRRRLEQQGWS
jgi:plasmid stability protein